MADFIVAGDPGKEVKVFQYRAFFNEDYRPILVSYKCNGIFATR